MTGTESQAWPELQYAYSGFCSMELIARALILQMTDNDSTPCSSSRRTSRLAGLGGLLGTLGINKGHETL